MTHPLVTQLHFARHKWRVGLDGLTEEEGQRVFGQMNSIAWMVGHLAAHEQHVWLEVAQGRVVAPDVKPCASGQPRSNPVLRDMLAAYEIILPQADAYLERLSQADMAHTLTWRDKPYRENVGTMLLRLIYHYWFHLGEMQAVRQLLGHSDLPGFVGHVPAEFQYHEAPKNP